ncbi:MAG: STAS/SEC14 domain-containing protein [Acidimicrobiales bacterium]|nr:STAS/SEC14 domain-containing protein [Acidimicrobiales bacterium]
MTDHISGEKFEAHLVEDGLVRFGWTEGATISPADAQAVLDAFATLTENVATPVLVDLRNVAAVDREARRMFASTTAMNRQALLVGSPLSRTLGNFFVKLSRPAMPVKLFDDEAAAVAWLHDDG